MGALQIFSPSQLALMRRTVAKDATADEFNLYIEVCRARGLNPLLRHAYCLIMSKDRPDKRQMVIIISIDGQRHIAEKTGNYRADDRAPRFAVDPALKGPLNPQGLISAEVSVYKYSHGEWFPVTAVAYWDEAVPLSPIWKDGKPSDEMQIAPGKDGWKRMPRLMLAKVAEMQALRKAFPDDFSGLYSQEEMDRHEVLDLTPSDWVEKADREDRLARIGGQALIIDWLDGKELSRVPIGKFMDRSLSFLKQNEDAPLTIRAWTERNRHALQEFWALQKSDALELKRACEIIIAKADKIPSEPIEGNGVAHVA